MSSARPASPDPPVLFLSERRTIMRPIIDLHRNPSWAKNASGAFCFCEAIETVSIWLFLFKICVQITLSTRLGLEIPWVLQCEVPRKQREKNARYSKLSSLMLTDTIYLCRLRFQTICWPTYSPHGRHGYKGSNSGTLYCDLHVCRDLPASAGTFPPQPGNLNDGKPLVHFGT